MDGKLPWAVTDAQGASPLHSVQWRLGAPVQGHRAELGMHSKRRTSSRKVIFQASRCPALSAEV